MKKGIDNYYYSLFMDNPIETIIVDMGGIITAFNRAKRESVYRKPEIGDRMYQDYASRHKIDMRAELMDCIKSTNRKNFLGMEYKGRDRKTVFLDIFISTFEGGAIIASIDINARRKMEENILRLQKLESLGVLAGGIAHDFNNLLTGILGNASLALFNKDDSEKQKELLKKVITVTERATGLTQQLLTFAKGGIPAIKIASISKVIEESVGIALGRGSSVKCVMTLPEDLWLVEMDAGQISQVFQNLIINARQAMPEGGIMKIRAKNAELASGNPYNLKPGIFVDILVEDEGVGIPKNYLSKIFDPYFTTKERSERRSGLGLAISYSIIQKHKGCISVESEPGKGTIFHIFLPATKPVILEEKPEKKSLKITRSLKILVMDDELFVLDVMEQIFKELGHQVELSKHGKEAIEKYSAAINSNSPFDLVFLDLTIPGGMGGVETLKNLKEINSDIIAIISSGYSNEFPEGFSGVMPKPCKMDDVKKILEEVMRQ